MERIVVTGGTGLVGQALIPVLKAAGYDAVALSRPYSHDAIAGAIAIINLAGENLSSGRWTPERKKKITGSRVNTLNSLRLILKQNPGSVKTLISASAVGYYGSTTSDRIFTETDPCGNDFLAGVCRQWEAAADSFEPLGIRVVKIRIGVVFSDKGGALPKLMMPLKFGVSVPLGSGKQWLPWIHLDDLVRIFLHLLKHPELSGPFNAVAPNPVTNYQLMKQLAVQKHRLFIPVGVPAFLLKAMLGEMAVVTLEGSRVSVEKLLGTGFEFMVPFFTIAQT
ncbi:MAG: TIGR01777 family oxidoreductase [Bacteroidales bacterium]